MIFQETFKSGIVIILILQSENKDEAKLIAILNKIHPITKLTSKNSRLECYYEDVPLFKKKVKKWANLKEFHYLLKLTPFQIRVLLSAQ